MTLRAWLLRRLFPFHLSIDFLGDQGLACNAEMMHFFWFSGVTNHASTTWKGYIRVFMHAVRWGGPLRQCMHFISLIWDDFRTTLMDNINVIHAFRKQFHDASIKTKIPPSYATASIFSPHLFVLCASRHKTRLQSSPLSYFVANNSRMDKQLEHPTFPTIPCDSRVTSLTCSSCSSCSSPSPFPTLSTSVSSSPIVKLIDEKLSERLETWKEKREELMRKGPDEESNTKNNDNWKICHTASD